ncbi:hypothetical protein MCOR19_006692 [Pyricularia oryzae]|nr:hypothetical protein MCOR19_006692 [Pyricularia oryzae]KAI6477776.1 hypothetical protein MCOR18_006527 [Pyricularia oryzae]
MGPRFDDLQIGYSRHGDLLYFWGCGRLAIFGHPPTETWTLGGEDQKLMEEVRVEREAVNLRESSLAESWLMLPLQRRTHTAASRKGWIPMGSINETRLYRVFWGPPGTRRGITNKTTATKHG